MSSDIKNDTSYLPEMGQDISDVENSDLTEDDMMQFISSAVNSEGLVGHNIKAFNDLINEGIPQILTELFDVTKVIKDIREQTEMDRQRETIKINFRFMDVKIGRPVYATYPIGKIMPLFPNESRISGRTYAAPLSLAAEVTLTAYYSDGREEVKRAEIPPFMVASIPMMIGSDHCHTWNLTREAKKSLEEDPNEPGGYFLAKGSEWVVEWKENISFNTLHAYKHMHSGERTRGEFISQPGGAFENSSQLIIRYMLDGSLNLEINSNSTKLRKTRIPFFIIFRLLGMTSDADIIQQIVYDPASDSPVVRHMIDIIGHALKYEDQSYAAVQNELNREKLTEFMAVRLSNFVTNSTAYKSNENAVQYLNDNLLNTLDRFLLPHIGREPSSRGVKLRYLGMLIHKTLLVDMDILESTDRDSYSNKRIHGAGVSIAKAFKTQFNDSVVNPVKKALEREVRNTPFEELNVPNIIDAFNNPMTSSDLGRTLEQAITSGDKSTIIIRHRAVTNRISTQALERKNSANYYSALRAISTHSSKQSSKQTERADRMRRVHPSMTGVICVSKSADTGEMVGMKKELAITASVCSAGEAFPLILRLKEDPELIPIEEVNTPDIIRKSLACVFVNGNWIGCCQSAHTFIDKYRILRRKSRIVDPQTSITWNTVTDDVDFHLDVGRLIRPLIIVDNNIKEYDEACRNDKKENIKFVQNIRLTSKHIKGIKSGTINLEDLRAEGVIEWITPQEAENCLVAPSLDELRANRNNVIMRYTHCDVEQAIFGLTALLSPFGNHTQPARVTYETNQGRQAGGWYSFAAPFRADKNRFFQYYCEMPLVRTISYNWLFPNGMNTTVAYMINAGYNQEDSAVFKRAFVQRGGFTGSFYRFEKAELEKGEFFGNPDIMTTKNLKPNASYEKLVDGFVPPGTIISKGDILIGRIARIQGGGRRGGNTSDDGYKYIDRSIVYHLSEQAIVTDVYRPRGSNDNIFGLVKLRYHRPLVVGDKLCLSPDHDVLTTTGWKRISEITKKDKVACMINNQLVYQNPYQIYEYDHKGLMYNCSTDSVDICSTLNHRMWVKKSIDSDYDFEEAKNIISHRVQFKRNVENDRHDHITYANTKFAMDPWLSLLGIFIRFGIIHNEQIIINLKHKYNYICDIVYKLGIRISTINGKNGIIIHDKQIYDEFTSFNKENEFPPFVWNLNRRQSRILLNSLLTSNTKWVKTNSIYHSPSKNLVEEIQRLSLHAGWSANISKVKEIYRVNIITTHNNPFINARNSDIIEYEGKIHCLAVIGGVFYVRRNGKPLWTGNSSRAGNKSITSLLLPDSDLPYDEHGITPDIIINPHCLTGDTAITQPCGISKRIDSIKQGDKVWGWTTKGLKVSTASSLMKKGIEKVYNIILGDGRSIRTTDGHPFLVSTNGAAADEPPQWVRADNLNSNHKIIIGPEAPLDNLVKSDDEAGWILRVNSKIYSFQYHREQLLAFTRILGLAYEQLSFHFTIVCKIDATAIIDDIEILTEKRPTIYIEEHEMYSYYGFDIPIEIINDITSLTDIPLNGGIKRRDIPWPIFLETAPKSIVREFLGGVFGGGGHISYIIPENNIIPDINYEKLVKIQKFEMMEIKMKSMKDMLLRLGIPSIIKNTYCEDCKCVLWELICAPTTNFAENLGFRYCIHKSLRLSAVNSYWRYLAYMQDKGNTKNMIEYFNEIECLRWFVELNSDDPLSYETLRGYIISGHSDYIPTFKLPFVRSEYVGKEEVYDISVPDQTSFVANGMVVHNSIPSRMTIGQMLETSLGLRCQEEGCITDGTSFRKISVDEISKELKNIGLRYNGLTRLFNGRTGEYYDAAIFMGPTYHQRLQKFVNDSAYVASSNGPTDALTSQPLEGKNARGGLRIGEMEAWVLQSHGSMMSLTEKMFMDSDGHKQFICRACGNPAIYNSFQGIYKCNTCKEGADIGQIDSCKASMIFQHELRSSNIKLKLGTRPREFEEQ